MKNCGRSAAPFVRGISIFPTFSEGIRSDMYAVIETGGKQYRVSPGDLVRVDTIEAEPGTEVELGRVVMLSGDAGIKVGEDAATTKVKGTITKHGRGVKIIVFKFKRKKQYKRTQGHRQNYTEVKVDAIA
jgi:large subunit ribosomal protein L21